MTYGDLMERLERLAEYVGEHRALTEDVDPDDALLRLITDLELDLQ